MPMFNSTHTHHHVHYHETDQEVKRSLRQLTLTLELLMAKLDEHTAEIKAQLVAALASITNVQGDLTTLNTKIADLQLQLEAANLTPAQEAALVEVKDLAKDIATQVNAIDVQTPPNA